MDTQQIPDHARVWVYQANRPIPESLLPQVEEAVQAFARQWVSHNRQLRAWGKVVHGQFIVLMADESQAGASGCSIDASVHFIKTLQAQLELDFFDRMTFTLLDGDEVVKTLSAADFSEAFQEGTITGETLVFDPLVTTKKAFDSAFLKPLKESWHARFV